MPIATSPSTHSGSISVLPDDVRVVQQLAAPQDEGHRLRGDAEQDQRHAGPAVRRSAPATIACSVTTAAAT